MASNKKKTSKEMIWKFAVGDILEAQGATLEVLALISTDDGRPAYEMRSPFTVGEPWLVGEWALEFARKRRKRK